MTKNLVPVEPRHCAACNDLFTPKIGGYNAKYCSKSCKSRIRYKRESSSPVAMARRSNLVSYIRERLKNDPEFRAAHNDNGKRSLRKVRQWLAEYKLSRGCIDCGYKFHFAALQLDHEGPKSVPISHARSSIARLQAEIISGHCKVRCANCHAIKTWERKQPQQSTTAARLGAGAINHRHSLIFQRKTMNTIYVHPVRSIVKACYGVINGKVAALECLRMFGYRMKHKQLNAKHLGALPKRVLDATAKAAEDAKHRRSTRRGA